jgi:hypothetical protein
MPGTSVMNSVPVKPENLRFEKVPVGKYALQNLSTQVWHVFEVQRPEFGKWAGWTFLKIQVGPKRWAPVDYKGEMFAGVMSAIEADPKHFAVMYGRKTGRCSICGRTLTNKKSIKAGIGPVCAENFGS